MSGKGQPSGASSAKKRSAAARAGTTQAKKLVKESLLMPSQAKNLRVGGAVRPAGRDLTRFVKWPRNVRIQRQRKVLYQRLKTPPAVNAFRSPLDKAESVPLLALLSKYRPETSVAKKERLVKLAEQKTAGGPAQASASPVALKFGLNHITYLVEQVCLFRPLLCGYVIIHLYHL
jgi:large subunit ribosomal protein L7Ae